MKHKSKKNVSKFKSQTKLSEEIITQKEELAKVKKERAKIIKNINSEKTKNFKRTHTTKTTTSSASIRTREIRKTS